MAVHQAVHPRDETDRLYETRKEERGDASIEAYVMLKIQEIEEYINKSKERERVITVASNSNNRTTYNKEHTISFQTIFVWALLLIVHT